MSAEKAQGAKKPYGRLTNGEKGGSIKENMPPKNRGAGKDDDGMDYILASASPRRREICRLAGIPVEICPAPDTAEPPLDRALTPEEGALAVAKAKAEAVFALYPERTVIGADTSVWCGDEPLGKPKDEADAGRMLALLQGRSHRVITAVWVCAPKKAAGFADATEVTFYPMTGEEIREYVATGEPLDKAGAYGIQGCGMRFIEGIRGDYYTVMGLPGAKLRRFLRDF